MKIKKIELNKLIKYSPYLLITKNHICFIKKDEELNQLTTKKLNYNTDFKLNKICFINKEIKKDLDKQGNIVEINIIDNYIVFNNLKIELFNSVVKYVQ